MNALRSSREATLGRRRPLGRRRGVAAVEFAIVAPMFFIMFIMVIGIIEIGRAMMVQQVLINASRVGARRVVMLSSDEQSVIDAVTEYAAGVGVNGVVASVSPNPATAGARQAVTANVTIGFEQVSWLPAPWIMGGRDIASSIETIPRRYPMPSSELLFADASRMPLPTPVAHPRATRVEDHRAERDAGQAACG